MNFAQMLAMDVKPLPDTRAPKEEKKWQRATDAMHEAKHSKAVDKYCEAIGDGVGQDRRRRRPARHGEDVDLHAPDRVPQEGHP